LLREKPPENPFLKVQLQPSISKGLHSMKISIGLFTGILFASLTAQASEREWQCLSAIQEELTRSNCVGKSHPVGGTKHEGPSGSFSCGFLHCKGEGKLVGANYYSFQDRAVGGKGPAAPLCVHVDGQTYAYSGMKAGSGRINLPGIRDQVSPHQDVGACRIPSPLGLHVAKNDLGQILKLTQVKALAKTPSLNEASDSVAQKCDDGVRAKIGAAAYALGFKTIQNAKAIEQSRFVAAFASCRGVPEMKAFQDGASAAKVLVSSQK
jgi:hypothetical protein